MPAVDEYTAAKKTYVDSSKVNAAHFHSAETMYTLLDDWRLEKYLQRIDVL